MKKYYFYSLFFLQFHSFAQTTKNVYFIGNSYTDNNNLPNLIDLVANSTNDDLVYQSHLPGGSTFQQHVVNPTVINSINQGNWDYVVLQQQSQMPSFPNANATLNAAAQLSEMIKNANPCGTPLFYMTWGRKFGDEVNCANGITYLCTYEGMDDKLYERYMQMTEDNEAVVSPVARVWRAIRQQQPQLELFASDNSHPSYLGSMVAAYTFYTVIFKKDPSLAPYNGNLSSSDATTIKNIVKDVVFDELATWKVGVNDVATNFTAQLVNGLAVQFTNESENATQFLWNFGDGTTSTEENPIHTYTNDQTYTVTLTTNACETTSSKSKSITVSQLSNDAVWRKDVQIFPNPASSHLSVTNLDFEEVHFYDVTGRLISLPSSKQNDFMIFNLESIQSGTYILHLTKDLKTQVFSFVKK